MSQDWDFESFIIAYMRRSCDCNTKLIFLNSNLVSVMMGHGHHQLPGRSWGCTLFTQIALCISLYMAFYMGNTLKSYKNRQNAGRDHDLYFLSVCGGKRPLEQQTHLLRLVTFLITSMYLPFFFFSHLGVELCMRFSILFVYWFVLGPSYVQGF